MHRSAFYKAFSPALRFRSLQYALDGLRYFFRREPHAWLHGLASVAAIVLLLVLHCNQAEWLWIIAVITGVWMTELLNTAIEKLADFVKPEKHPAIAIIKDISAAAVLVAALAALITGVLIFIPKLL